MKEKFKFLAISGSLRSGSYNTRLLEAFKQLAPNNIEIEVVTLSDIPMFSEDLESKGIPKPVGDLVEKVKNSNALIIATPEYNATISGVLLNTLEWLSRSSVNNPTVNKPVGVVGASTGQSATVRAQQFLKSYCITLSMHPFNKPAVRIANAQEKFNADGELINEEIKSNIIEFIEYLYEFTIKLR